MAKVTLTKKSAKEESLKARRELFCQFFVRNSETRGIATLSYAEAYDYNLDTLSKADAIYEDDYVDEDGVHQRGKLIQASSYDRAYSVCGVEGARLLKNPKVQDRITELRNEMLEDRIVDGELEKVIIQDRNLAQKVAAIHEYNALRNRVKQKSDEPSVVLLTDDIVDRLIGARETRRRKQTNSEKAG